VEDILYIHKLAIDAHGGMLGVRDANALISAISAPSHTFGGEFLHATIPAMAAAYWFSLSENQPFLDGNKRTALLACETFLDVNGLKLSLDDDIRAYDVGMQIATGQLTKEGLVAVLESSTMPR